jgi:hypothetical protein
MKTLFYSITMFTIAIFFSQASIANALLVNRHKTYYGRKVVFEQVIFTPGSLRANIERVARRFHWNRVIWNSSNDYRWAAYTKINRNNLQDILQIVLVNYPLQAVFFEGNHVLVIQPRTLR